jgi:hypothetical protein
MKTVVIQFNSIYLRANLKARANYKARASREEKKHTYTNKTQKKAIIIIIIIIIIPLTQIKVKSKILLRVT